MRSHALIAITVGVSLVPLGVHAAPGDDDGLAAPAEDTPEATPEGPAEAPSVATPPPVAPSSAPEPEYKGKGLIGAAIGVTALSWVSRATAIGLAVGGCNSTDFNGCTGRVGAAAAFLYLAPISQFAATGLVIPGGLLKGRHDAWRAVTTGSPDRNGTSFIIAGGVVFGVFTAVSIILRPAYLIGCLNSIDSDSVCVSKGGFIGYNLGVQLSDTLSTTGAGLMSYGIGYNGYKRRYAPRVSVAPFGSRGAYGLSFSGSF